MDSFNEESLKVPFGEKSLDAAMCVPTSVADARTAVVLTHGAGGDMGLAPLVSLARACASAGFLCLRFTCRALNLDYRARAYRAVWEYLKSLQRFNLKHIYVGGDILAFVAASGGDLVNQPQRSMGCRAAAALARQLSDEAEDEVQGLICLSFPLHPPRQTHSHRQRSADLRGLPAHTPVLFVSGTGDSMCDRVLFDETVKEMKAQVEVFWLKGGSHGLSVKGRSEDSVLDEVNSHVISWLRKHAE